MSSSLHAERNPRQPVRYQGHLGVRGVHVCHHHTPGQRNRVRARQEASWAPPSGGPNWTASLLWTDGAPCRTARDMQQEEAQGLRRGGAGVLPLLPSWGWECQQRVEQRPKAASKPLPASEARVSPPLPLSTNWGPEPGQGRAARGGAALQRPAVCRTPPRPPSAPSRHLRPHRGRLKGLTSQQVRERGPAVTRDRVVSLPDVLKQLVDVVPLERVQACRDVIASPPRARREARSVGASPTALAWNQPGTGALNPPHLWGLILGDWNVLE